MFYSFYVLADPEFNEPAMRLPATNRAFLSNNDAVKHARRLAEMKGRVEIWLRGRFVGEVEKQSAH